MSDIAHRPSQPARTTPIRAVIFDIGRVIVRINISRAFGALGAPMGLSPQEVWSRLERDPLWNDWQEGRIEPRVWHQHITARFHSLLDFGGFCDTWNRALEPETILKDALFMALAHRVRLGLLSNTDPIHVAHMEKAFSFWRHFPVRVYSCAIGAVKPSPAIYRRALSELSVAPHEAVYIDDIGEFVEAARQLGMTGIHFTGPGPLEVELRGLGVLTG
jgi:glucose-1-phosphatase